MIAGHIIHGLRKAKAHKKRIPVGDMVRQHNKGAVFGPGELITIIELQPEKWIKQYSQSLEDDFMS